MCQTAVAEAIAADLALLHGPARLLAILFQAHAVGGTRGVPRGVDSLHLQLKMVDPMRFPAIFHRFPIDFPSKIAQERRERRWKRQLDVPRADLARRAA